MAGDTYVSRFGTSELVTLGLDEWVASTPEEYIAIAERLSYDRSRLAELHGKLRERMRCSRLLDAAGFTRELEAIYRAMRHGRCEGQSASNIAARCQTSNP